MSLNPAMIYRRTDRGVREVYEKSHQFTQSERLILILLDGRLNVAGLQARLPSLNDERIGRAMGKLQEAGLVEPMGSMEAIKATGLVPEIARLEPEAVAHFLEQTDLDPVTVFGATEEEVASELVRASVEKAAAQLAREAAGEAAGSAQLSSVRTKARVGNSGRSHLGPMSALESTIEPNWDATEATRFAITTVNVPDRLDLQEERDRAEMDEYAEEHRRATLRAWMKRLLIVAVVGVFGAVLYGMLKPLRDETSTASGASGSGRRRAVRGRRSVAADQLERPHVGASGRAVGLGRGHHCGEDDDGCPGAGGGQGHPCRGARAAQQDFDGSLRVHSDLGLALVSGAVRRRTAPHRGREVRADDFAAAGRRRRGDAEAVPTGG